MVSIVEEITPLVGKHAEFKQRVTDIKRKKEETISAYNSMLMPYYLYRSTLTSHLRLMNKITEQIKDRMENPQTYPIGGGCGTIHDCKLELVEHYQEMEKLRTSRLIIIQAIQNQELEFNDAINDAEEDEHQFLYMVGLDTLKAKRTEIGKQMSCRNRLQQEAYEFQKERYESCKQNKFFTEKDREFIEFHKEQTKFYKEEWLKLADARDKICELINVLDPEDIDDGYDEYEDSE